MKFDPNEVIHSITMLDLVRSLERRLGKEEASNLSDDDQALLKEELVAVIESMDQDLLEEAIDAFMVTRNL